ncbi:MAG TPA: hypothetical protein PK137_02480 [Anaerolineaceae bacterium]|nr:hypothetical protein [Anaerolineaceae bacterium]HOR83776.1 hypothetical protein [Anaerolineaceae bacterium]HPL42700.1 hypothetical protein [Anaerolineaceae bacterium]
MNLKEIQDKLQLRPLTAPIDPASIEIRAGYTSDMLSCVMTGAPSGSIWVTLMAHGNIIAVATLLDIPAIIITENAQPDDSTLARASEKEILLYSTNKPSFEIVGRLWEMGIRSQ